MSNFYDNTPAEHRLPLSALIDAVTETRMLLDQVAERFGSKDPADLQRRLGEMCGGIEVSEAAVQELEQLLLTHEQRREACREYLEGIQGSDPTRDIEEE